MKKGLLTVCALASVLSLSAQDATEKFQFTVTKECKVTPMKDQASSGTCWCYSGISFFESELMRMGKGEHDLSEMFVVAANYKDKADKFVRMHGKVNFSEGGSFHDVLYAIRDYGIVPQTQMQGLNYGTDKNKHSEIEALLNSYVNVVIQNKNGTLDGAWKRGYNGVVDAYFGAVPTEFVANGKKVSPQGYAKDLGIDIDNYVSLSSFTYQPLYRLFAIEVPDNWRWGLSYNVQLDELMTAVDNALENGYSVAWASDVSETGFLGKGVSAVPYHAVEELPGTDQAKWLGLSAADKKKEYVKMIKPGMNEMEITPEMRQQSFDNYTTTDDHGMHIYGKAKDQTGKVYYMVKNSWGEAGDYKGVWYVTPAFIKYKTLNIVLHKDALSKDLKKKLNLK